MPGRSIRDLRQRAGLTQIQLCVLADCSISMLAKIEAGVIPKRSAVVPRIMAALDQAPQAAPVTSPPLGDRWETIASRWNTGFSCIDIARELHVTVDTLRHEMVRMRKGGVELLPERSSERLGLPVVEPDYEPEGSGPFGF